MYPFTVKMELSKHSLDIFLAPVSMGLTLGYHLFLWYNFKNNHPSVVAIRAHTVKRREWFLHIIEDSEKNGLLTVQSLRNSMMTILLVSSLAVILNSSLGAQANNVYSARRLVHDSPVTSSAESTLILKFTAASLFLLLSFFCSSLAASSLTEASFLICVGVAEEEEEDYSLLLPQQHAQNMLERGFMLAFWGERMLYVAVPLMVWMFGPVAMTVCSLAMVWVLYQIDFAGINGDLVSKGALSV